MYVILVNDDNTMMTTKKQRIMQRSKLVDDLWFLVKPNYNGHDMSMFTASLEYVLPVSKKYCHEILTLSSETYNGYLTYMLPVDTELTTEPGEIELQLTFLLVDLDENGEPIQRIRKVTGTSVKIFPISTWSDIIPDEALSALDQRIIKTDAQIKALSELVVTPGAGVGGADGLDYDEDSNELQLKMGDELIGNRVTLAIPNIDVDIDKAIDEALNEKLDDAVEDAVDDAVKEGIPVVNFNEGTEPVDPPETDNVVEF